MTFTHTNKKEKHNFQLYMLHFTSQIPLSQITNNHPSTEWLAPGLKERCSHWRYQSVKRTLHVTHANPISKRFPSGTQKLWQLDVWVTVDQKLPRTSRSKLMKLVSCDMLWRKFFQCLILYLRQLYWTLTWTMISKHWRCAALKGSEVYRLILVWLPRMLHKVHRDLTQEPALSERHRS